MPGVNLSVHLYIDRTNRKKSDIKFFIKLDCFLDSDTTNLFLSQINFTLNDFD